MEHKLQESINTVIKVTGSRKPKQIVFTFCHLRKQQPEPRLFIKNTQIESKSMVQVKGLTFDSKFT